MCCLDCTYGLKIGRRGILDHVTKSGDMDFRSRDKTERHGFFGHVSDICYKIGGGMMTGKDASKYRGV